jgi:hypothetical protein
LSIATLVKDFLSTPDHVTAQSSNDSLSNASYLLVKCRAILSIAALVNAFYQLLIIQLPFFQMLFCLMLFDQLLTM